jgi:hypothetical protein
MKNRAERADQKQAAANPAVGQLLLPMIAGIARSKLALLEWVHQVGWPRWLKFSSMTPSAWRVPRASTAATVLTIAGARPSASCRSGALYQASPSALAGHFGRGSAAAQPRAVLRRRSGAG